MLSRSERGLEFLHRRELSRFVVVYAEKWVGRMDYVLYGENAHLVHTEVDPAWRGRQIASVLTEFAITELMAEGLRIVAECPFAVAYLKRHPIIYGD